jgi:hypothetical protein
MSLAFQSIPELGDVFAWGMLSTLPIGLLEGIVNGVMVRVNCGGVVGPTLLSTIKTPQTTPYNDNSQCNLACAVV